MVSLCNKDREPRVAGGQQLESREHNKSKLPKDREEQWVEKVKDVVVVRLTRRSRAIQ